MKLIRKLWNDEAGFIVSTELILVASLLVISMVVGLATIRDQVVAELGDTAGAISELNQSVTRSAHRARRPGEPRTTSRRSRSR